MYMYVHVCLPHFSYTLTKKVQKLLLGWYLLYILRVIYDKLSEQSFENLRGASS